MNRKPTIRWQPTGGFNSSGAVDFRAPSMFTPGFGMNNEGKFGGFGGPLHPFQQSSVMPDLGIANPAPGGNGIFDKIGKMFQGPDGTDKLALILGGAGLASDIYGKHKQGKIEDEERERKRRSAESVRPVYEDLLLTLGR